VLLVRVVVGELVQILELLKHIVVWVRVGLQNEETF